MSIALYRIDDRLIHGQVVVGWGQPLDIGFIVLVDDNVACCDWEQDLYRMGVPPEMQIIFADVENAIKAHASYIADPREGLLVVPDVATMERLINGIPAISEVNLGGIHHRAGRTQKLRYLFLAPDEEDRLRELTARGVKITGRDVPAARIVPITEILAASSQPSRSA